MEVSNGGKCIFVSIQKNDKVAVSKTHQGWQTPELPLGFLKEMVYPSIWSILIFLKKKGAIFSAPSFCRPNGSISPPLRYRPRWQKSRRPSAWELEAMPGRGHLKKRVPVCLSLMEWTRVLPRKNNGDLMLT